MTNYHYSFEQWCLDNNRGDLLARWDMKLNNQSPSEVSFKSNKKYWFKCPVNRHKSELNDIQYITSGRCENIHCKRCDSFAQHIIDEYGNSFFRKIWSKENTIDPWKIAYKSNKIAKFNCLNKSTVSHTYPQSLCHFAEGIRCGYCHGNKHSTETSLGNEYPQMRSFWSEKNKKTCYDYNSHSQIEVWWKCQDGLHEDYKRSITRSVNKAFFCPECGKIKSHERPYEDIVGQVFGELTVLSYDVERSKIEQRSNWLCLCSCGRKVTVDVTSLKDGNTKSCGNRTTHYSGENNGNWQGGITPEHMAIRASTDYLVWRRYVLDRDGDTCQCCGNTEFGILEAHHIYNFADYPDLRLETNNGITLCYECHIGFHKEFGTRNNTPKQLEEFVNKRRASKGISVPFILKFF